MKNVKVTREGSKLLVEIDLSQNFGLSKSKESEIIASTCGNVDLPGTEGVKLGVNCYRKAK